MPNRLARETSPYLLQHAHNPVDWYPWGDEAFARARAEDRPVLLSVGYAACHWCHVMERESFEDADTARLMNERFVNVKVDREERPDVDQVYMAAVQAMTGHGGWPMTVFLTPGGEPFVGGTYFPPEDRHGMPSFRRVLASVADAWGARRDQVERTVASLRTMYARAERGEAAAAVAGALTARTLERAVRSVVTRVDHERGGLAGAPKFPPTMAMEFLLAQWARTATPTEGGDPELLEIPLATFRAMARGGIYDQVGGGFHRYSVDAEWTVPHFEKMLYDNALLVRHGVHLWQATGGPAGGPAGGDAEVRRVVEETLDWVAREMTDPAGGFYSTLDADSEGHEGKFYVWGPAELEHALGADAAAVAAYWEVTPAGNFEGRSILLVDRDRPSAAEEGPDRALADAVRRAKPALLAARAARVRPARDEKLLAAWNGLMLRAVADAARAFGRPPDRRAALDAARFAAATFVDAHTGHVRRVHARTPSGDAVTKVDGFLEDHAALGLAFLACHALDGDARWLELARRLGAACVDGFWDDALGAFFDTAHDAERLVTRPRDATDNAVPSGTSLACELLLALAEVDDRADWRGLVSRAVGAHAEAMARYGPAFGQMLQAADALVHGATTVAVVGANGEASGGDAAVGALLAGVGAAFVPALVVAAGRADDPRPPALLAARPVPPAAPGAAPAAAAAYVCRHSTCSAPVTTADALSALLRAGGRSAL